MKCIFRMLFFFLGVLFAGNMLLVSCRGKQVESASHLDAFSCFYATVVDSITKNPNYVCVETRKRMAHTKDSLFYRRCAVLLSKAYMFKSEIDSAELCLNVAEGDSGSLKDPDLFSEIYNMRGNLVARQGKVDTAVEHFTKALNYRLLGKQLEGVYDIAQNLADAYVRTGQFDKGAFWYRKALFYNDSLGMPKGIRFSAYYGLAQVYMELRDFEQCDYYYDMAAQSQDNMLPYEQCIYFNNRGNSYYFRKDYSRALDMFREELTLARKYPDMVFEVHLSELNMGETFLLMSETDSASFYLNKCISFFREIDNTTVLYHIDTHMIKLALELGNIPLARKRLDEAVKLDCVEPNMLHIRNRYLQQYFEESGDFKNAYYYQRENQRIDDSIRNERIKMRTAEIDLKYRQDTTVMKQKLFIQQKENEVLELNQKNYCWMSGCIGIFILVVFVYLYHKKQHHLLQIKSQNAITALRMENIRNRVSPHFIFNILNREMGNQTEIQSIDMHRLVKLMRCNLELTEHLCVTLADEIDFIQTYIELERKSLGDQFVFHINMDDEIDTMKINLPSMMIQIPVENAIKHALKNKAGERKLWIDITRGEEETCIRIKDNGGGYRMNSENRGTGTGMKVIFQTIQLLNANNKKKIGVSINNVELGSEETGCEFLVTLPDGYGYDFKKIV